MAAGDGRGGARPGAGAKKHQHRITVQELRSALEARLGMPYQEMLAETQVILFNKFKMGENVKEYVTFTENMAKRIVEQPIQEVAVSTPYEEMSSTEIQGRIDNLLTRAALASNAATQAEDERNREEDENLGDDDNNDNNHSGGSEA